MNLCLGTVQFGMNYGIRGQKQPSLDDAVRMLDFATQNGVDNIDTANAYGSAEDVVGSFLAKKTIPRDRLFIISKLKPNIFDGLAEDDYYAVARSNLESTFKRIGVDYLDAYMCHSARYVYNEAALAVMHRFKQEGLVRHCGVSVYEPEEAKACIKSGYADFMQLPLSIFDQRMIAADVFSMQAIDNIQVHSRSAFIQGLILMSENEVPQFLSKARPIVSKIRMLCTRYGISPVALAMGFVKRQIAVSHLVFGVDNIDQLREDIEIFHNDLSSEVVDDIGREFRGITADIVMPSLWTR